MELKIKVASEELRPVRANSGDAGLDLKTAEDIKLKPGERIMASTGVSVAIPHGYYGLVAIRSSIGAKHAMTLSNSVGIIDSGYRNELKLPLINLGKEVFVAKRGERIAQLIIQPCALPNVVVVDELDNTERGLGGFGSTGKI